MQEEWRSVVYNGVSFDYSVSSLGRVMNKRGKLLKPWLRGTRNGTYPCVRLQKGNIRVTVDVHRLVAVHFVPNPSGKPEVNHFDNDHCNPERIISNGVRGKKTRHIRYLCEPFRR